MDNFTFLTPREAAFVLDADHQDVLRELDAHPEHVHRLQSPNGPLRQLAFRDILFLRAAREGKGLLTSSGKDELYQALIFSEQHPGSVRLRDVYVVDVARISSELRERLGLLAKVRESVEQSEEGSPLIKETGVDAYRVAALASTSREEAQFEYPSLSREQIELASQYAAVYPKPGRPYPTQSLKRMLLGSDLGELNQVVEAGRKSGKIYRIDKPATKNAVTKDARAGSRKKGKK